jgi:hypothetical protein
LGRKLWPAILSGPDVVLGNGTREVGNDAYWLCRVSRSMFRVNSNGTGGVHEPGFSFIFSASAQCANCLVQYMGQDLLQ